MARVAEEVVEGLREIVRLSSYRKLFINSPYAFCHGVAETQRKIFSPRLFRKTPGRCVSPALAPDILHPLHIDHVVDMTVFIDGSRRYGDRFGIDGGEGHSEANYKRG